MQKDELDQKYNFKGISSRCNHSNLVESQKGMRNYAFLQIVTKQFGIYNILTNQDILSIMATKKYWFRIRQTRFSYCNTNYAMLALIIEKITKLSYKDAMHQIIFRPLGMKIMF
jgi:hypothetical protein